MMRGASGKAGACSSFRLSSEDRRPEALTIPCRRRSSRLRPGSRLSSTARKISVDGLSSSSGGLSLSRVACAITSGVTRSRVQAEAGGFSSLVSFSSFSASAGCFSPVVASMALASGGKRRRSNLSRTSEGLTGREKWRESTISARRSGRVTASSLPVFNSKSLSAEGRRIKKSSPLEAGPPLTAVKPGAREMRRPESAFASSSTGRL